MMASQITLEHKFVELLKSDDEAKQTYQNSRPRIQKVAQYLRNRNNIEKHFSPKFVAIGPIHHDNENLMLGENYKLTWALRYTKYTQQSPQFLLQKIVDNIDELRDLYAYDVLALVNTAESLRGFLSLEEKLAWLLFVDGCFLLYILLCVNVDILDEREHMNITVNQLVLVMRDVLLLENQLPYLVLKLLWKNDSETELLGTMKDFLKYYNWNTLDKTWRRPTLTPTPTPTHLLELQRKIILQMEASDEANHKRKKQTRKISQIKSEVITYWNIKSLGAIGIKVKSSGTRRPTDVDFSEGWFGAELTLPEIIVDDNTAASFLNLIAYEMCPDFENDYGICSFVVFMESLIDHPEDVRELRSKGILLNTIGRDEKIVNLFKIISTEVVPNIETYADVNAKINQYISNKWKIWIALTYNNTYFSIAAVIALILTFIQTWFTIFPRAT